MVRNPEFTELSGKEAVVCNVGKFCEDVYKQTRVEVLVAELSSPPILVYARASYSTILTNRQEHPPNFHKGAWITGAPVTASS